MPSLQLKKLIKKIRLSHNNKYHCGKSPRKWWPEARIELRPKLAHGWHTSSHYSKFASFPSLLKGQYFISENSQKQVQIHFQEACPAARTSSTTSSDGRYNQWLLMSQSLQVSSPQGEGEGILVKFRHTERIQFSSTIVSNVSNNLGHECIF